MAGIRRSRIVGVLFVPAVFLVAMLAFASTAAGQAADDDVASDDQIVLNGRLDVPEDDTVGMAVIFNGPATIEGTVREGVVVLNGDAEISGSVGEDVVVLNGDLVVRSGADVGGDLVSQSDPTVEDGANVGGSTVNVATRFDWEEFGFASRIAWWVGFSVSTILLGVVLLLLLPGLDGSVVSAWRERTGGSVGWGLGAFFLLPVAAILLLVTVLALPLGLYILLGLALLYTVGYVAGALVLGRLVVKPPTSRFLAFLVGWVILRAIALIPVVGGLVFLLASVVGLGVLVVNARRHEGISTSPGVAATPPPPVTA